MCERELCVSVGVCKRRGCRKQNFEVFYHEDNQGLAVVVL